MLIMDRNQNKIYAWTKHRIHGMIVCDGRTCNSYTVEDKKFLRERMFNMTNLELKKHANDVRLMVPSTRFVLPIPLIRSLRLSVGIQLLLPATILTKLKPLLTRLKLLINLFALSPTPLRVRVFPIWKIRLAGTVPLLTTNWLPRL